MSKQELCAESEIPVGTVKGFKVADTKVLVYHLEDGYYATQNSCTHLFAPLGRGKIVENCQIQCPFHKARFDIKTGEVVQWANFPPGVQMLNVIRGQKSLKTYPVTVENGKLKIEV